MKRPFKFTTGDNPSRLIGDTLALLLIIGGVLAWLWWLP